MNANLDSLVFYGGTGNLENKALILSETVLGKLHTRNFNGLKMSSGYARLF